MNKFTCTNKKCKHEFYTEQNNNLIICPICNYKNLNTKKVITSDNFLWLESMFHNIQFHGKEKTLELIDKIYSHPITRAKIRRIYFETLKIIENG